MMWFRNLRMTTKLIVSVAAVCVSMELLGYMGISKLSKVNGLLNSLYRNETVGISHFKEANIDLVEHQKAVRNIIFASSASERKQLLEEAGNYASNVLAEYREAVPTIRTSGGKKLLAGFWPAWTEYKKIADSTVALALSGDRRAVALSNTLGRRTADTVGIVLSRLAIHHETGGREAYLLSDTTFRHSREELIYLVVALIAGAVASGLLLCRLISRPIVSLEAAAAKVADGDTDVSLRADTRDELGNLSASFNRMVTNIRTQMREIREKSEAAETAARESEEAKLTSEMQSGYLSSSVESMLSAMNKFADGDLTVSLHVDGADDISRLFAGFNRSVANINSIIQQLQESIETTAGAASQISSSSEQLAAGAQEQSSQANEVAAAVEEMTRTIIDNSKNASETADAATRSGELARESGGIVRETSNKMRQIAEVVRASADTILKLGRSSSEISEIISVIDGIADQTNLLALNAAIEAARAGDQGKGFAVVADEVRKLAERTTQATKQIERMIKAIQSETEEAVGSIRNGTGEVEEGMILANRAGEAIGRMVAESEKSMEMSGRIAAASEEQSATSEQISRNVETISTVSSDAASGISQIARSSEELNKLTERLRSLVSRFRVNGALSPGNTTGPAFGGNGSGRLHAGD